MPEEALKSHVRVFLSADLVGSTRLKNHLNHQELYEKYRSRWSVLNKIRGQNSGLPLSDKDAQTAVLETLGVSTEDFDWASVVEFFYKSFHSKLSENLDDFHHQGHVNVSKEKRKPWKAVGDELIYQFEVKSRRELYWITIAFLIALRTIDQKVKDRSRAEHGVRIKGSAWVAGFPVRNRVINLPGVDNEDFLGPDIDAGFRIGKCTQAGMLVASVELAELLSEAPGDVNPIIGKIVGWKLLKGVWNDKRYPVVWIDLPSGYPKAGSELKAHKFDSWQQVECSWCKTWESLSPEKQQLREFVSELKDVRKSLPKSLGLVDPYIVSDADHDGHEDHVPEEHRKILELIQLVTEHQKAVQQQDADGVGVENATQSEHDMASIDQLFEGDDDDDVT